MSKLNLWRVTLDTNPEDCNLKCIMCEEHSPYSNFKQKLFEETGVKRRLMPMTWIEDIMRQAKELGVEEVIPSTMGEPLIYKGIEKVVELCHQYKIKLNLTTNGTFPRKSVTEWANILVPVISDVKISWNGATKETAQKVMLNIKFDQVLENVKAFIAIRDKYYQETGYYCRVSFQLTFMENNMHELADIVKLAAKLGVDRVKGHHLWAHFTEIKSLSMKSSPESVARWNHYVKEAQDAQEKYRKVNNEKVLLENIFPIKEENEEVPESYECPFLNKELWVSAIGNISPCCAPDELRQTLGDFGNIQSTTLTKVLESPQYQNLSQNYRKFSLCKTCNMRRPPK